MILAWSSSDNTERAERLKECRDDFLKFSDSIESVITKDFSSLHLSKTGHKIPITTFNLKSLQNRFNDRSMDNYSREVANLILSDKDQFRKIRDYCQELINFIMVQSEDFSEDDIIREQTILRIYKCYFDFTTFYFHLSITQSKKDNERPRQSANVPADAIPPRDGIWDVESETNRCAVTGSYISESRGPKRYGSFHQNLEPRSNYGDIGHRVWNSYVARRAYVMFLTTAITNATFLGPQASIFFKYVAPIKFTIALKFQWERVRIRPSYSDEPVPRDTMPRVDESDIVEHNVQLIKVGVATQVSTTDWRLPQSFQLENTKIANLSYRATNMLVFKTLST